MSIEIETVNEIMVQAGSGYLATTDGEKASVRPMGCPQWVGGELWLATNTKSEKIRDIQKKNQVEFCIADKSWRYVRIAGTCTLSEDVKDRKTFWDRVPVIKEYFKGEHDPHFGILRIKVKSIRLMTEKGETILDAPKE